MSDIVSHEIVHRSLSTSQHGGFYDENELRDRERVALHTIQNACQKTACCTECMPKSQRQPFLAAPLQTFQGYFLKNYLTSINVIINIYDTYML